MAWPIPPAAHTVMSPNCPPRRIELVGERDENAAAGRAERMPDRDRAAHHVELRPIDFANRLGESGALGPLPRHESGEVAQHLRGKRLVHLDEIDVARARVRRAAAPPARRARGP